MNSSLERLTRWLQTVPGWNSALRSLVKRDIYRSVNATVCCNFTTHAHTPKSPMFTDAKIAQIAAVLAHKQGGSINILKLMKLMYLVDRTAMEEDGDPITFDVMFAMHHGPILSKAYDFADNREKSKEWSAWLKKRWVHDIRLKREEFSREDLDQLSNADLRIIEKVWNEYGDMSEFQLRDYVHVNCEEWQDPGKGRAIPMREREVLEALGKDSDEIDESVERIKIERNLDRMLSGG